MYAQGVLLPCRSGAAEAGSVSHVASSVIEANMDANMHAVCTVLNSKRHCTLHSLTSAHCSSAKNKLINIH